MPTYSYRCGCSEEFEAIQRIADRASALCPSCGETALKTIGHRAPAVHDFKLGTFEHIAHEPVYAKSKKHLKELCNRHGCYAPGVLD